MGNTGRGRKISPVDKQLANNDDIRMSENTTKAKRIIKNTIVLYVRMIVVLLITLYTSRLILKALGVDDFGLYNVVGGVIGLLTFFKTTLAKTTQRFLNIGMVQGNTSLSNIFASSITVHILFSLCFFVLCESIGLWFLNSHINIPVGREFAANVLFQTTIVSLCISLISIPYDAAVIAYERMTFVAVIGIIDAILKLGISIFLLHSSGDRLVYYGISLLSITIFNFVSYYLYCREKYSILKFRISFDRENLKQIFGFVSWTMIGQFAIVGCNQGNVVLVNTFHSLVANAAMSVGSQVNHAITNLTSNFQTAFNPQITKSYAEGNFDYLRSLVYSTSKLSFCILFVVALPISYNIDYILELWLDEVPEYSNIFAVLFLVNGILNAFSTPFNFLVLSSGSIRNYQIVVSIVFLLDLPIVYLLFSLGMPPATVLWVKIGIMAIACVVRMIFASLVVPSLHIISYLKKVLLPLFCTASFSVFLAFLLSGAVSFWGRSGSTLILIFTFAIMIWTICLNANERKNILVFIRRK